ncbi:MAG: HD domain-containing protein [Desulfobulbaceae bacterium]|nr:HD domain-containing protein [Desulfobulbaceae bacterium]
MKHFLGKSKLSRKFVLLFMVCAFLPTFVLLFVSYDRVSGQLVDQSVKKLIRETKTYGLSLYERLIRVSDQLAFFARLIEMEGVDRAVQMRDSFPEISELFDSIVLLTPTGELQVFIDSNGLPIDEKMMSLLSTRSNKLEIYAVRGEAHPVPIYLSLPVNMDRELRGYLVAKVNVAYLWGIGSVPLLPTATELAVYDESGSALVGTYAAPGGSLADLPQDSEENQRQFEYLHDDRRYYAGRWNLFLESRFGAGSWTVVLSQSEEYLLATLKDFKRNLFLAILLGLWLILFVSLLLIRRGFAPLGELQKRTRQIAAKDFTSEISLASGDEFEELAQSFNVMSRQLGKQFAALETIDKIDRAILSSITLPDIIAAALPMLKQFFACETVVLGLEVGRSEHYLKSHILSEEVPESTVEHVTVSEGRKGVLFQSPEPFVWPRGLAGIERISVLERYEEGTIISVALFKDDQAKGIIILGHRQPKVYDEGEMRQLRQLADQLSIALSNSELVENLEKLATGTIEALARTVDAKSKWTAGHSERVSMLAGMIAGKLGLSEAEVVRLNRGGLLHDIGKIGVGKAILDKPSRLTDAEYKEIMTHPEIGVKILEPIEAYQDILPMVLQHHERFDGSGYPLKLAGKQIDLSARILAVADVYDALSSVRPYRPSWSRTAVLDYIADHSGSHFDPDVVAAFRAIVH